LSNKCMWEGGELTFHPDRIERQAEKYLATGADSLSFYESARILDLPEFSRAIRRINNPAELPSRIV
ncbi:MAG: hypothetical protein QF886_23415, partial [Planctomycetota bacterium]|nr:hypothetical protein [Planctomycetota bacterium]